MKKLILGLLSAAIIILSFSACKQASSPAPVAPVIVNHTPEVLGAMFIKASDDSDTITWSQAEAKKQTTLEKSKDYKLCVRWKDAMADANRIQLCKNTGFDPAWQWIFTLRNPSVQVSGTWVTYNLHFTQQSEAKAFFTNQSNRPLYVRVLDSAGNISSTYTISGITITD